MTYNQVCNKFGTDKGDLKPMGNCYADFYESWFTPLKNKEINILEIGVDDGKSLQSYFEFFPKSHIYGLDINSKEHFQNSRIKTVQFDQSDLNQIESFSNYCFTNNIRFDFIVDDGSHDVKHQQMTFGIFFNLVLDGGFYILEDLGSSYFTLGTILYGYEQTQDKINNNTIKFLTQRPFYSPWISPENLLKINDYIDYVSIFDKVNVDLPYSKFFNCVNNQPIRSITSIIKKK